MLAVLIVAAILGCIPGAIAQGKGRSFALWWVYGLLLFPIALIHILLEPNHEREAEAWQAMAYSASHRACPFCAEPIQRAAIVCRHCGRDVPAAVAAPGPAGPAATTPNRPRGPLNFG